MSVIGRQLDREHEHLVSRLASAGRRAELQRALATRSVTSASDATAYSVAQRLVETAWSIALRDPAAGAGVRLDCGPRLVQQSYDQAKEKAAEESAARRERRETRRAERGDRSAST